MEPIGERDIRSSFVNCSKGEAGRIRLPQGFAESRVPCRDLDFLGWTDPGAPLLALFVAPLAGAAGRQGNTVGEYLCSDLACSLYLRGRRRPKMRLVQREETLSLDERIERAMTNLSAFVDRVAAG
jgi:hypothetical protein